MRVAGVGFRIPKLGGISNLPIKQVVDGEVSDITTDALFEGKKVVLVGVPAAFSPTCSDKHIPGYLEAAPQFKAKGVDIIAVLAVNDLFTMKAWAEKQKAGKDLVFLGDGNGDLTRCLGVELNLEEHVMGKRTKRFSALVEDGVIQAINIEPDGTGLTCSAADKALELVDTKFSPPSTESA